MTLLNVTENETEFDFFKKELEDNPVYSLALNQWKIHV